MATYRELKERARATAIEWQTNINNESIRPSLDEFVEFQEKLERLARRFGLLKEFRENGLI